MSANTIEIDVEGRWGVTALMRRVDPYDFDLVQFAPRDERLLR